ncbi:MAG: hypothetical protein IJY89_04680 [Clostridia bacterium]|nr:hypothetical protein [Clostridia bacterium]
MFSLREWLKKAFVNGVARGEFSGEYIAIKCAEQVDKGRFSEEDAESVFLSIEKLSGGVTEGGDENGHTD